MMYSVHCSQIGYDIQCQWCIVFTDWIDLSIVLFMVDRLDLSIM